jgi:fatty acid desaturase
MHAAGWGRGQRIGVLPRPIAFGQVEGVLMVAGPALASDEMRIAPAAARPSTGSEYAELRRLVQAAGLLDRSAIRALPRILAVGGILAAAMTGLFLLHNSWWQLVTAVLLAAALAQLGFLAHEAGHQQIFRTRRWNDRFGLVVSNGLTGLSYGWWVDKHNRHHSHPNDVDRDPDVGRNILAWTSAQADAQRGLARRVARNQALYFFPLLLLEALNLQVSSIRQVALRDKRRRLEAGLLAAHGVGSILLVLCLMSPLHALAFIGIEQGLLGLYLGVSFAPNHKGMPMTSASATSADFLRRQVLTSRNVRGGRLLGAGFGGLNYQIEHHLFPSMPSRNLRRARQIVKPFCAERAISYHETSPADSYRQVLRYLGSITPST